MLIITRLEHKIITTKSFLAKLFFVSAWDVGLKVKEGRDFPLGNGSGTGAITSGIGFTTCSIKKVQKYNIVGVGTK